MNIHDQKTVERHARLLADYAIARGCHNSYVSAGVNPYAQRITDALAKLPRRVSLLAVRLAVKILEEAGRSIYVPLLGMEYPAHVVIPRNTWDYTNWR